MHEAFKKYLKNALSYGIPFGAIMTYQNGWPSGPIAGLFFGIFMSLLFTKGKSAISQKQWGSSPPLVLKTSNGYYYLVIFGFWMFFGFGVLSAFVFEKNQIALMVSCFLGFCILMLWGMWECFVQVIIGRHSIIRRTLKNPRGQIFDLRKFKAAKITWYQGLKIFFHDGQNVTLYVQPGLDLDLEEYKGTLPSPSLDTLYRLKQEIERRAKQENLERSTLESSDESIYFTEKYEPKSFASIFVIGVFLYAAAGSAYSYTRSSTLKKIQNQSSDLRLDAFQNAFEIYRGKEFLAMQADFERKCAENQGHHCRLAAYLKEVENDKASAAQFYLKGCHSGDNHSCYNVYISSEVNRNEKEQASLILDKACRKPAAEDSVCCDCFKKAKSEL